MRTTICTLFEGNYHYGAAALINSLYYYGFRGEIFLGYKEKLPFWASQSSINQDLNWEGAKTLNIAEGLDLHFLPVRISYHLTNYKPTFLLELFEGPAQNNNAIFYFDPDIVVKKKWSLFENWIENGVAIVKEIVNNDLPYNDPQRRSWERVISKINKKSCNNLNSYLNAGFCGVQKKNISFLKDWQALLEIGVSDYQVDLQKMRAENQEFSMTDQNAFNMAAMCSEESLCISGPQAMGFINGTVYMAHATGTPKPWNNNFIFQLILKGKKPSLADKAFWQTPNYPIQSLKISEIIKAKSNIQISSILSRFYGN